MKISEIDELFEKCWKGYEKKGMKTMFGKRVPNCVKKESIEVDDEGAIAIVNFHKDFDWNKVSHLADQFDIAFDIMDDGKQPGDAGKYYLSAEFADDIAEFGEHLFNYDENFILDVVDLVSPVSAIRTDKNNATDKLILISISLGVN